MASYTLHDLQFILAQIKIAEADVAGGAAINQADLIGDPLLPYGLRTVTGEQNNLVAGQNEFGSVDNIFPRLLDPVFLNLEPGGVLANGDQMFFGPGAPIITNNNYGVLGSVADSTPRTISNLIADQTGSNPAAIAAAIKYYGVTNLNASTQISAAYAHIAETKAAAATAQTAENAAVAALAITADAQNSAEAAYTAAQVITAAYTSAAGLANAAETTADAAKVAISSLLDSLAIGTPLVDAGDQALIEQAITAATDASNAAAAVLAALGTSGTAADAAAALAAATNTTQLVTDLTALQAALADGDIIVADADMASAALVLANSNHVAALALNTQLDASLLTVTANEATALGNLNTANTAEGQDIIDLATATATSNAADATAADAKLASNTLLDSFGIQYDALGGLVIPNTATDEGLSAQYNSWFTLFGQFFDHGLDSAVKGGSGTVYIPLKPDDPLYVEGSHTNFMVITRATNQPGADGILGTADDVRETINTTSPFIDQNQTYSSHPSHQVFLRAYELVGGRPQDTGELIENRDLGEDGFYGTADDVLLGGMATWAVVKAQARDILGINLTDADVTGGPLLATDDYGNFIRGANGMPQLVTTTGLVEGNIVTPISTATAIRGGYAFLDDIAHNAAPGLFDHDNNPATPRIAKVADADSVAGGPVAAGQYDNELLEAHYIAGDGRVNENIGLTAVHAIFHSEHNRLVQHTKDVVLASNDLAFINEWLSTDLVVLPLPTEIAGLNWDGQRLFQAAKFGTEMQYQHLVFEEFGRKVQVQIDVFAGYDSTINPAIVAEFAHVVYRFGHSMLNETVDRYDANFNLVNGATEQIGLIEAFLNPLEFAASGIDSAAAAGAIARGMTRQAGNELDEFVTEALRNNLVGLPLDLAAINIARGRDTGVPSLNAARRDFYAGTSDAQLKPYESWVDFANNIKHAESAINFIAAYGTHTSILAATNMAEMRDAAMKLVFGDSSLTPEQAINFDNDRSDFLNSVGIYANLANGATTTGVDAIDFWMGGLAERQMPFGGLLGSTFNFVFETQMEKLQDGDRFYYLARTAGLNFLTELEGNSFASLIMRNSDATHLPGDVFSVPNFILEVDQSKQYTGLGVDGRADPTGGTIFTPLVVRNNPSTVGPDSNYLKFTGGEHVVLGGTSGNDILIASIGDDTIWGDAGDDRIEGGDGVDILNGGDGNDIITDLGGDDNIKGGDGDDVISGGNGFDLILAGGGSDFVVAGEDPKEVFGNQGNDFILTSSTFDTVFGNQGDDWIDGGGSADLLQGDMGDPFQASTIFGNDVLIGGGGNDDYDSESGDDIMVMAAGTQRAEGMLGFDWVTHKNQGVGANADLAFTGLLPPDVENLNDRFDNVEGLSGWNHNDILRGDSFGSLQLLAEAVTGDVRTNHALNSTAQIALIGGLQEFLDSMLGAGQTGFSGGNIIMGGGGSDLIEGRGGDDLLDGDAWLNVRIAVTGHPTIFSAESMAELAPLLFSGVIKPSQLSIVREIKQSSTAVTDVDTAVFNGNRADYSVVRNGDGTLTVTHTLVQGGVTTIDDGTDRLRNFERLQFADINILLANSAATGTAIISDQSPTEGQVLSLNTLAIADANGLGAFNYQWQASLDGVNWTDILGATDATFVPVDLPGLVAGPQADMQLRAIISFTDSAGYVESITTAPTTGYVGTDWDGTESADSFSGTVGDDIADGNGGSDVMNGNDGNDILNGGNGTDTLNGGIGADTLNGGNGNDIVNGGAGNDTILFTIGEEIDTVDGGGDTDTLVITGTAAADTLRVVFNGTALTQFQGGAISNVESVTADLLGINDTLNYGITAADVTVNLATGTASGFTSITNIENVTGGSGADTLTGTAAANTLNGGIGADNLNGGDGNDTYIVDNTLDVVNEAAAAGTDTVQSSVSIVGPDALAANVENLTLTGSAAINGTGNTGNNIIIGNSADNTLNAGTAGTDSLRGGAGNDTYVVDHAGVSVTEAAGQGTDTVLSSVNTTLSNNVENLTLTGTGDINGTGNGAANVISGNSGNNALLGGGGNDTILAGAGNDTVTGGAGQDTMTGGTGKDTFVYTAAGDTGTTPTSRDIITDFATFVTAGANSDVINLIAIDANSTTGGNQAFTWIGTAAFSDTNLTGTLAAGQIRYQYIDTDGDLVNDATLIQGNVNNNLAADFSIQLSGVLTTLGAADFVL